MADGRFTRKELNPGTLLAPLPAVMVTCGTPQAAHIRLRSLHDLKCSHGCMDGDNLHTPRACLHISAPVPVFLWDHKRDGRICHKSHHIENGAGGGSLRNENGQKDRQAEKVRSAHCRAV